MATKILTLNIRKYLTVQPRTKRRARAVKFIRGRIAHFTKTPVGNVNISPELNNAIIKHYAKHMVPLKLNLNIDKGMITASPFSEQKAKEKQPSKAESAKDGAKNAQGAAAQAAVASSPQSPAPGKS